MSRVIEKRGQDDCKRWDTPALNEVAPDPGARTVTQGQTNSSGLMTRRQADTVQEKAHKEGFELGYKEGRIAGEQHLAAQADRLQQLMITLTQPFTELDKEVEKNLAALITAIARQVIRREIELDPDQIMNLVQEAMGILQNNSRSIQLCLHPDDADYVRKLISMPSTEAPWQIIEDPVITKGGCMVVTEVAQVDATVESRINAAVAAMLGEVSE